MKWKYKTAANNEALSIFTDYLTKNTINNGRLKKSLFNWNNIHNHIM